MIAAGFPTSALESEGLTLATAPKFFIENTRDQFGPRDELEAFFRRLAEPKRLIWIEAAGHFFTGALDDFERAVESLGAVQ